MKIKYLLSGFLLLVVFISAFVFSFKLLNFYGELGDNVSSGSDGKLDIEQNGDTFDEEGLDLDNLTDGNLMFFEDFTEDFNLTVDQSGMGYKNSSCYVELGSIFANSEEHVLESFVSFEQITGEDGKMHFSFDATVADALIGAAQLGFYPSSSYKVEDYPVTRIDFDILFENSLDYEGEFSIWFEDTSNNNLARKKLVYTNNNFYVNTDYENKYIGNKNEYHLTLVLHETTLYIYVDNDFAFEVENYIPDTTLTFTELHMMLYAYTGSKYDFYLDNVSIMNFNKDYEVPMK